MDKMACYVACKGQKGNACKVLVGNPKGKRPLGRCGHSWEDNNKTDLQEREWVWTESGQVHPATVACECGI